MNYNYNEDYQYDSCVSRGICSVNPRTSSLQEILVLYLKNAAYYAMKLYENGKCDKPIRDIILNTISIMVSNPEFAETDFQAVTEKFNIELPRIIKEYEEICAEKNIEPDYLKSLLNFDKETDIVTSIQMGEKEFLNKAKSFPQEIRDLYKVLFVLAKSICINVLDLETFGTNPEDGYLTILKLLNILNDEEQNIEKLKELIFNVTEIDNKLMRLVRATQVERYGKQRMNDVSYSTIPGKAVLVVGSNIRELEDVLEAVKDLDIDVYTHDEMMLAHTFPKFMEYKHLRGQFGQGMENCLLDFATFPGPIVLTRHSLYNVEHLYRGLLYTTDFAYSKGVIPIKDKNFAEVIKSAQEAKGFKSGRQCETVSIGFDYDETMKMLGDKIKSGKFSRIFVVGINGYTLEQQTYFSKLLKQTPDDVLVVSLSYCTPKDNIICLNACFDTFAPVIFTEGISEMCDLPVTLFFPKCDRHTISQMIYLSHKKNVGIYVGKCTPIMLNPNLISTLNDVFSINGLTSVKKDLEAILNK